MLGISFCARSRFAWKSWNWIGCSLLSLVNFERAALAASASARVCAICQKMSWMRCRLSHLPGARRHDFSPAVTTIEAHRRVLRFQEDKILERRWISHDKRGSRRNVPRNALAAFARLLKFAFAPILARDVCGGKCECGCETIPATQFFPHNFFYIHSHTRAHETTYWARENKSTRHAKTLFCCQKHVQMPPSSKNRSSL